ncbi:MAG: ABC transporter ATP-binding protein/permease [Devosia sp.]|nr:ABC transporter ATP-binding protein/permease [Devosia sp.]
MLRVLGQFWRLLSLCVKGPGGKLGLLFFALVVALNLGGVYATLRIIAWTKDFYSALEAVDASAALAQIGVFGMIVGLNTVRALTAQYLNKLLLIRWRRTLTEAVRDRWLSGKAYWHMANGDTATIDNPDQRIADDCRLFLSGVLSEAMDLITNVVAIFSYIIVLWNLSTFALSLDFVGLDVEIPRYMLVAAFVYVALSSLLTHVLGAPLKTLYVEQQRREADFRFALARMRSNVDEIAMLGGEAAERRTLDQRFGEIMRNWKRLINRELILSCFTFPYNHTVLRIPLFVALPAFLAGSVNFGGLMEISTAFSSVVTTLSWFIFSYRDLADLVAASSRLDTFLNAADRGSAAQVARPAPGPGPLDIRNLELRLPNGRPLLRIDALQVAPGEAVWLAGASGLGKTTLFKAIAGLWSHADGQITAAGGTSMLLPQKPYMPIGTVTDAVAYPCAPEAFPAEARLAALDAVGLGDRLDAMLGEAEGSTNGLSGGEMQRLALARLLLHKPDFAFLDEATSALDLDAERQLLGLLRERLPHTAFVVVAHREPTGFGALRKVALGAAAASPTPTLQPALA